VTGLAHPEPPDLSRPSEALIERGARLNQAEHIR
jgi:hypothetical protein